MTGFQRATKKQAKLRLALEGPAGYGKTYTGLTLASYLREQGRVAMLDTEAGSASKYADLFDFDVIEQHPPFHPDRVTEGIELAVANGYDVFFVDSLSHFWAGDGGLLDIVDQVARTKYRGDSHRAWKDAGEIQQRLVDAILRSPIHIIAGMRTKTDYVRDEVEMDGGRTRTRIRKAGTKVVQRDEFDYEFDLVGRFEIPCVLTIIKSRCATLPPDTVIDRPGVELAQTLKTWLGAGAEVKQQTDEQRDQLLGVLDRLAAIDPAQKWADLPGKVAVRDHGVALGSLSFEQMQTVIDRFEDHWGKLNAAANGNQQTLEQVAS